MISIQETGIFDVDKVKEAVETGLRGMYPIQSQKRTLEIEDVNFGKPEYDPDNFNDISSAIKEKKSITIPVKAKFTLKDKETGKKISSHTIEVASIPVMTKLYNYVINGVHYDMPLELRLKAGAYPRVNDKKEAEVFNNFYNGSPLRTIINPSTREVKLKIGQGTVPIYPVLKILGVEDDKIKDSLGEQLYDANKDTYSDTAIKRTYKALFHSKTNDIEDAKLKIKEKLHETESDPEVNKKTLNKAHKNVTGDYLLDTVKKVIEITKDPSKSVNRDELQFKGIYGTDDLLKERLLNYGESMPFKIRHTRKMDSNDNIGSIIDKRDLQKQIDTLFTSSKLSRSSAQINPIAMINSSLMTTLLGEGGIGSKDAVPRDSKLLQNSHMGFIDSSHTPESHSAGVTLTLSNDTRKRGHDLETKVINLKTGRTEWKSVVDLSEEPLAFPNEFSKGKSGWVPKSEKVSVIDKDTYKLKKPKDVKYMIASPSGMFDRATNTIPFSHSNQGNRLLTGSKMAEQALGLSHPEKPLVEVYDHGVSLLDDIGKDFSVAADQDGVISKITKKGIYIKTPNGELKHNIFDDVPLNDHAILESRIKVKVGDKVKKGQILADSTFTEDGKYVNGVNLNVAYMPWEGHNFEDGIVAFDNIVDKLESVHLYKKTSPERETGIRDIKLYKAHNPFELSTEQLKNYDNEGIIKKGTKVGPGDILVAGLKKNVLTGADTLISRIKKSAVSPYKDVSVKWDKENKGEVVDVVKRRDGVDVYVKTYEKFKDGDKLVGRHGNKGVAKIFPSSMAPITKDGTKIDIILAPEGVPPRINLGQVIETGAGKLAAKTGKVFKVENYSGEDYVQKILKEMKKEGISDKETLILPKTGEIVKGISTGKQYIHKLKQQIDTKTSARGISEAYTRDNQPTKGKGVGGQAVDRLTTNALLAYNARDLVSEMSTIKNQGNYDYWRAIQHGEIPPAPKASHAWKKFESMLKNMGVNTVNNGTSIKLSPLTDKEIMELSSGEIADPTKTFIGKGISLTPDKEGLFGEKTGGLMGNKFNHFTLKKRIVSPVYKDAVKSVLHLTEKEYQEMLEK